MSWQLDAIFVALKLHQASSMFESPAISRRQIAVKIAPCLHVRLRSCNFRATKIASSCRDQNRLCKRAFKEPTSETLLHLAELVSTLNCFSFADNYYKQINGVAMGTKMVGPSYANLFVGYIEHQFFNQYNGLKPELYSALH